MTAEEFIVSFERELFTGSFSESFIKNDLEARKTRDTLSTMGSGMRTNLLGEKRKIYIQDFKNVLGIIEKAKDEYSHDSEFLSRCERCKNQANRLLDIVLNF